MGVGSTAPREPWKMAAVGGSASADRWVLQDGMGLDGAGGTATQDRKMAGKGVR